MRKTFKKTNFKSNNGITLIALVITIIVLLLLAGVAISMLSGENSIITKAQYAAQEQERANIQDLTIAGYYYELIAATQDFKYLNMEKTAEGIYANLTNNGYKLKDTTGTEITSAEGILSENKELISLNVKGNHGDYTGEVTNTGLTKDIEIVEEVPEETPPQEPEQPEEPKVEVTIDSLKETGDSVIENKTLTDANGLTITIPQNFNIASESPTEVTKGIIIEDSKDNQYVWIPVVEKTETYTWGVEYPAGTTENDYTGIETALKNYTINYNSSSYSDVWYGDSNYGKRTYKDSEGNTKYYTNGNMTEDEYNALYQNMLTSVYKNKGFYIGRYEMGIEKVETVAEANAIRRTAMNEYKSSSDDSTNEEPKIPEAIPVSKANAVGYNYITQSQAQMLAEELGNGADYSCVNTSIMFGVQWDMVCVFIENFDTNNTATTRSEWLTKNTYLKLWGNYKNSEYTLNQGFYSADGGNIYLEGTTTKDTSTAWLYTTGAVEQNSSLNIYDFMGNLMEFTLERSSTASNPCRLRGGYYRGDFRNSNDANGDIPGKASIYSSRITFYVNN